MPEKLYVLIRRDLTVQQQAVQAGHAVAEYLLKNPEPLTWTNGTLVYLSVSDKERLRRWSVKLKLLEIPFVAFKEPDLNDEVTAIAVTVTTQHDRIFQSLRLATFA